MKLTTIVDIKYGIANSARKKLAMFAGIFVLLVGVMANYASEGRATIIFTEDCQTEVIRLIDRATKTIDIAVYSINNEKIVEALVRAKERQIKIRIITDRLQAFGKTSKVPLLHHQGFNIRLHSLQKIMHHKFALFDGIKAIEGSFNWTAAAGTHNAEDCNVFAYKKDLKVLKKRFTHLWDHNSKWVSECYFRNIKLEKGKRKRCKAETTNDEEKLIYEQESTPI